VCRLFGMSGGHRHLRATFWLLEAPDSLAVQSRNDPDGTGLGIFLHRRPLVHRCPIGAFEDAQFEREARHVRSRTFIAHVRYASGSPVSLENTHPFEQDGRLFAHNGVLRDLDALDAELGPARELVRGQTDSERFFALVTREIMRANGDVQHGLVNAAKWAAKNLAIYALNLVLVTPDGLWALRYPETHGLFVLERPAGGTHLRRLFDGSSTSGRFRIRSLDLLEAPAVVVASEPLDENPAWRPLEVGELVHVGPRLEVESKIVLDSPPATPLTYADLYPDEAASQAPR
jgi:predicted glutamine amidotransferase